MTHQAPHHVAQAGTTPRVLRHVVLVGMIAVQVRVAPLGLALVIVAQAGLALIVHQALVHQAGIN